MFFNKSWRIHFGTETPLNQQILHLQNLEESKNAQKAFLRGFNVPNLTILPLSSFLFISLPNFGVSYASMQNGKKSLWQLKKSLPLLWQTAGSCGQRHGAAYCPKHAPNFASKQFSETWCSSVLNSSMRGCWFILTKIELERISKEHLAQDLWKHRR